MKIILTKQKNISYVLFHCRRNSSTTKAVTIKLQQNLRTKKYCILKPLKKQKNSRMKMFLMMKMNIMLHREIYFLTMKLFR